MKSWTACIKSYQNFFDTIFSKILILSANEKRIKRIKESSLFGVHIVDCGYDEQFLNICSVQMQSIWGTLTLLGANLGFIKQIFSVSWSSSYPRSTVSRHFRALFLPFLG